MFRHGKIRLIPAAAFAAFLSVSAFAVMGLSPEPVTVKLTPAMVSVDTTALAPKLAESAMDQVWRLFDRDTETRYMPLQTSQITVSLPASRTISHIRVYGASSYQLSVSWDNAGTWEPVPSLSGKDLSALDPSWHTLTASEAFSTQHLLLEFMPLGNVTAGIREIEILGPENAGGQEDSTSITLAGLRTPKEALDIVSEPPSHILEFSAAPSELSVAEGVTAVASMGITQDPALFKRAYLLYDGYNLVRSVSIRRRINGRSWAGGFAVPLADNDGPSWASSLEEINPAWLVQGENRIEFQTTGGAATIRGLRLIIETDSGWNFVASLSAPESYDGDIATGYAIHASATDQTVEVNFERLTQPHALKLHLAGPAKVSAALQYKNGAQWQDVQQGWTIDLSGLRSGWNEIVLPSAVAADALRIVLHTGGLRVKSGVRLGAINEIRLSGSPVGAVPSSPRIVVSYPRDGEYFGRTAYIQGFASPASKGADPVQIKIEGKTAANADGSFSVPLSKDETRFSVQSDDEAWDPSVASEYAGQPGASVSLLLNRNSGRGENGEPKSESRGNAPFADNREKHTDRVSPGQAKKIQYKGVTLDIPAGAVDQDTDITIIPLTEPDLARLNPGMINVTFPDAGYRFLPHGMKFKKPIKISFGYSKHLLASGQSDDEVNMYYYDEAFLRWQKLTRMKVDPALSAVESQSDHFTDIINATLVVPEHPQALSFNPNSIKDIKAADPSAGVNLIDPPKANNKGTANLSYPIEVPPGRNKLQPKIAVQYSSGGGNGWMGLGWDIPLQAVTIDTRWGVPRYDGTNETETYLLDGEQLTPLAHRGPLRQRAEGTTMLNLEPVKIFHSRVEGKFLRIIRHGTSPKNYWWEIIDKNGTKYFYGGKPDQNNVPNSEAVLAGPKGIFKWALREVRDTNGNTIRYSYDLVSDVGLVHGTVPGYQLYVKEINYTGSNDARGAYSVIFIRDRELSGFVRRTDVTIDARSGFKMVTADLLRKIEVYFGGSSLNGSIAGGDLVRKYEFRYNENPYGDNRPGRAFNKTLLTSASQYGKNGNLFNAHRFSYYDEARRSNGAYNGFSASSDWSVGHDDIGFELMGKGSASALGANKSDGWGGHIYIGVGSAGDTSSKQMTGGLKVGYSRSTGEGLLTMADMDGDGLPDKVFKSGGFYYRKNLSGPRGVPAFGEPVPIGLPAISREKVTSTTIGAELYFGLPVMYDHNEAETESDAYFSDVNGDGLTDVVSGGSVLFGYLNAQGRPVFSPNSGDTPVPITAGTVDTNGLIPDPSSKEAEREANFPLMDTIRRWVAPYDGVVRIDAPVRLIEDTSQERALYQRADGVQLAIQLEGAELWSLQTVSVDPADPVSPRILANDYSTHAPTGVESIPVKSGDRIYFRVQSVYDGAYDRVEWDPLITYLDADTTLTDVNGRLVYQYQASQDFTLAGRRGTVTAPLTGTMHLDGTWEKNGITTDDVTLVITRNGSEIYRRTLGFAETEVVSLSRDVPVAQLDVLEWRILVDSPVDITRLKLTPKAYYTSAEGVDDVKDENGNYIIKVNPPYDMDLYPASNLTVPQASWKATQTGTLTVVPALSFDNQAPAPAEIVFAVKKRGALIGKSSINISRDTEGYLIISAPTFSVGVNKGDELFFDFSARDPGLIGHLTGSSVQVTYHDAIPPVYQEVPSGFHSATAEDAFPMAYRGWGVVGYNGNSPRGNQPINQSMLVLDDSYDPHNARVYPYAPLPEYGHWGGLDEAAWVKATEVSSSRLGLDDIRMLRSEDFAGAAAPSRLSESSNDALSIGVGGSKGDSESKVDFQDLNGDRFPDVIGSGGVQYTRGTGQLDPTTTGGAGLGAPRMSENESFNVSTDGAGNIARAIGNSRADVAPSGQKSAPSGQQGSDMPRLGFGANAGYGTSETDHDLIDINGDGLPDKVSKSGSVSLNLGYQFGAPEPWGGGVVNDGQTINGGINMGFSTNYYSLAGGLSLGLDETWSDETYVDINGDGLPDKVYAGSSTVLLNTGAGFTPIAWHGGHGKVALDLHASLGGGVYFTFGWNIYFIRIVINPGVSYSASLGRPEYAFRDVDGDGFADHLHSEKNSQLKVALNPIGRTNLLKSVKRPLGGKFDIEYTREGNTYEMPQSQWVMTKVSHSDGMGNSYRTDYSYSEPNHDRYEREFYGFRTVTEKQAPGTAIARQVVQTYYNSDFYRKGLVQSTVTRDMKANPGYVWSKSENEHQLLAVKDGLGNAVEDSAFPALIQSTTSFYDGSKTAETDRAKYTYQTFEYDDYGNVKFFSDLGEMFSGDDDVAAGITYYTDLNKYIIKPETITIRNGARQLRKRTATYYPATGNLWTVTLHNTKSPESIWTMTYYDNGNLRTITDPVGYQLTYTYDPAVQTYVTEIRDNFPAPNGPYYSTAGYNLSFGQPDWTRDLNGNFQVNLYDEFGRMVAVCSPYDASAPSCGGTAAGTIVPAATGKPTIAFEYRLPQLAGEENDISGTPLQPARAVTQNKAVSIKGSDGIIIRTVTFADGLKRIIQTKKDADVDNGNGTAQTGMTVSGKIVFDVLGRAIQQGQPKFESASLEYVNYSAPRNATLFSYDTLDRTTEVLAPDSKAPNGYARTATLYTFGVLNGQTFAKTIVIDPEGNKVNGANFRGTKISYRDVRDRIVCVVEYNRIKNPDTGQVVTNEIITRYDYDPLGQITTVTDNKGNVTTVEYDDVGNRTAMDNPDTGKTVYNYDANGNLKSKFTANNHKVSYRYVFNRLTGIDYPNSLKTASVTYEYGRMGEAYNRAGRVKKVTDESGIEERFYGKLGETIREEKTVEAKTPAVQKKKFGTDYVFDSFGRMVEMTYPDGETLRYAYDNGGLLKGAWGEKSGNRYNYITSLLYDEFGQRTDIAYGNGTRSRYTYDELTRRLTGLKTVLKDGREVQRISYDYDLVGNVGETWNNIAVPTNTALPAGPVRQQFAYDDLYQIVDAKGWYSFGPGKGNNYRSEFFYDTIGNFTRKKQEHEIIQPSAAKVFPKETNYELQYIYDPQNKPHAVRDAGDKVYSYDANGNMTGWTSKVNGTRRVITWSEENRVKQIDDNGKSTYFLYDDAGERVVKRGPHGETIYVNRFFSIRNGELGTKSIYAGATRVVSKLVKTPPTNTANSSATTTATVTNADGTPITMPGINGLDNGGGKKLGIIRRLPDGYQTGINPPIEKDQFYYHGDHLGSSNIITDAYGAVYQHIEYFPYGETWIEEGGSYGGNTPGYKFTGKELDPETGLYYYGARYYDPVLSRWISADPMLSRFLPMPGRKQNQNLPGMGGVYNAINLAVYAYTHHNPLKYTDPEGLEPDGEDSGLKIHLLISKPISPWLDKVPDKLDPFLPAWVPKAAAAFDSVTQFTVPSRVSGDISITPDSGGLNMSGKFEVGSESTFSVKASLKDFGTLESPENSTALTFSTPVGGGTGSLGGEVNGVGTGKFSASYSLPLNSEGLTFNANTYAGFGNNNEGFGGSISFSTPTDKLTEKILGIATSIFGEPTEVPRDY